MSFIPSSPLFLVLLTLACVPFTPRAISSCNGPCRTLNDCAGQLICINGKCNDDPDLGTHICGGTPPSTIPPPPRSGGTISSCNGPCRTLNDCAGQLICIKGKCNDDPNLGTHICTTPVSPPSTVPPPPSSVRSPPPPSSGGCQSSGTLVCGGMSYPEYSCSPPVTSSTSAILTNNDFSQGGDGGAPSECDNMYHQNSELIVALSTGWYSGGSRCGKMINMKSVKTGRTVKAKVVDECDSINGCDAEHAYQPPCRNNIVDGSDAVWSALGLDKNVGEEDVTWSMA